MKTILLSEILIMLLMFPGVSKAQLVTVTGKIINHITGEVIRQVSVIELNSGIGTISSGEGAFSLYLKAGKVELDFTDEQYKKLSTSFELKSDTVLQILMQPQLQEPGKKIKREPGKEEIQSALADKLRSRR
jgi:hypothetical protein